MGEGGVKSGKPERQSGAAKRSGKAVTLGASLAAETDGRAGGESRLKASVHPGLAAPQSASELTGDSLIRAIQRQYRVSGRSIAHEFADIGSEVALFVERIGQPAAFGPVLVLRQ